MLPTDPKARKAIPVWSGCIAYFPNALVAIAGLSQRANDQHNPGEPLHWAMEKSTDEQDAGMRHAIEPLLIGASEYDNDGTAHKVKKAWRACAELERWLRAGNMPFMEPVPAPAPISVPRCAEVDPHTGKRCVLSDGHPTAHTTQTKVERSHERAALIERPARICFDCGADLEERGHAESCLRGNRSRY